MNNPISTYRLQFHKDFNFADFEAVLPYLQKLGIQTIYASPIFEATPGSVHGYDGMNPHKINPEIGTEEDLLRISDFLNQQGIHWLQDIVPNHMAFDPNNPWLKDVLEKGQLSEYASFFDVPWTGQIYHGKIMLPFLGNPLNEVIANGELKVAFEDSRFVLTYFSSAWPLSLHSYATILEASNNPAVESIQQLVQQIKAIKAADDPKEYKEPLHEFQLQLAALHKNELTRSFIDDCISTVNQDTGLLEKIANQQVYQLCDWQKTDYQINFRRFFTVNGLICLNMQKKEVFDYYHTYIKQLLDKGVFKGLRIDHVDGLFDPTKYLEQLRQLAGPETYIVVEKILEPGEDLPAWPIEGNTGYDFLCFVNNLFTQKSNRDAFSGYYENLAGKSKTVDEQIFDKKAHILQEHMGGELNNLFYLFLDLGLVKDELTEEEQDQLKEAIGLFLIKCPVYRFYGNSMPLGEAESASVEQIFQSVINEKPQLSKAVGYLQNTLLVETKNNNSIYNDKALRFYQRCMQFTGPLMAKGVEDTLMYTYNNFIAHNEVGDSPEAFGDSVSEFHLKMQYRKNHWPISLNGTSTHDTKRGEDVRARLNVLSEMPDEFFAVVEEWRKLNAGLKQNGAPDANDEYLIYQTFVGAYPNPGEDDDDFSKRIQEYLQKALREAKVHSNWTTPNEDYEGATKAFAAALLTHEPFWKSFRSFHAAIADYGVMNALSQVVLKFTCPGVPDVYQGTELWDFSLVDPDNRRPVDYEHRKQLLTDIEAITDNTALQQHLWQNRYGAAIKLWLVQKLLHIRKANVDLFTSGDYLPLQVSGDLKDHLVAFARLQANDCMVVLVPLHLVKVCNQQGNDILKIDWGNTSIQLPPGFNSFTNLLTNEEGSLSTNLKVTTIFNHLPLAVLKLHKND